MIWWSSQILVWHRSLQVIFVTLHIMYGSSTSYMKIFMSSMLLLHVICKYETNVSIVNVLFWSESTMLVGKQNAIHIWNSTMQTHLSWYVYQYANVLNYYHRIKCWWTLTYKAFGCSLLPSSVWHHLQHHPTVVSHGAVPSAVSSHAAMLMVAGSRPVLVIAWWWHIDLALLFRLLGSLRLSHNKFLRANKWILILILIQRCRHTEEGYSKWLKALHVSKHFTLQY